MLVVVDRTCRNWRQEFAANESGLCQLLSEEIGPSWDFTRIDPLFWGIRWICNLPLRSTFSTVIFESDPMMRMIRNNFLVMTNHWNHYGRTTMDTKIAPSIAETTVRNWRSPVLHMHTWMNCWTHPSFRWWWSKMARMCSEDVRFVEEWE